MSKHYPLQATTYELPSHYASFLVNDDPDRLSDNDLDAIIVFLNSEQIPHNAIWECGDNEFFAHYHDLRRLTDCAAMCLEFTAYY